MGEVIEVNFKEKKKIKKYVIKNYICLVCNQKFVNDSRLNEEENPSLISVGVRGYCVCKDCAVDVASVVKEEKWENSND